MTRKGGIPFIPRGGRHQDIRQRELDEAHEEEMQEAVKKLPTCARPDECIYPDCCGTICKDMTDEEGAILEDYYDELDQLENKPAPSSEAAGAHVRQNIAFWYQEDSITPIKDPFAR